MAEPFPCLWGSPPSTNDVEPDALERQQLNARLIYLQAVLGDEHNHYCREIVATAAHLIDQQYRRLEELETLVAAGECAALLSPRPATLPAGPLLPGEAPRNPAPLSWEENPAPDSRSPLEAVISQPRAIRALVRHYGWVHTEANTLYRPHWPFPNVLAPSIDPAKDGSVTELVDARESIGELARRSAEAMGSARDEEAA